MIQQFVQPVHKQAGPVGDNYFNLNFMSAAHFSKIGYQAEHAFSGIAKSFGQVSPKGPYSYIGSVIEGLKGFFHNSTLTRLF
jgi:hypothetical protein